jgi:hypothetical protein
VIIIKTVTMRLESGKTLNLDVREEADIYQRVWDGLDPFTYVAIVDGRIYRGVIDMTYGQDNGSSFSAIPTKACRAEQIERHNDPESATIRAETAQRIRKNAERAAS